ncbi:MAG: hypothetical protein M1829_006488 [Trizodia sp. TS-e1964]|nr:MAG: hypothetical protein M1829_006488 [Trizodia sp. TS-e1964]
MTSSWIPRNFLPQFHHSQDPISLESRSGALISLPDICKAETPPCQLNPLLFNGHLQTAWTVMKVAGPHIFYRRKVFEAVDPAYHGSFAVDFVVDEFADGQEADLSLPPRTTYFTEDEFGQFTSSKMDSSPMLVLLHGLSGGSHEVYLRHVLALIGRKKGWEACVVNSRGCSKSKLTSPLIYNARFTPDVRQMVAWLHEKFPNRPLFGIGFSLGASILTNYVGEEGSNCLLNAAVVCSNPWDLSVGSVALQRTWLGLEVYSRAMGGSMKSLFNEWVYEGPTSQALAKEDYRHIDEVSKNPNIDVEAVQKVKYLHEFDSSVQCATWGYPTGNAYYRDASSSDALLAVRIPFLAINAVDDPIAANEAIPYAEFKANPYTVLCTTAKGGHLGWFEIGGQRWFAKPAANFLVRVASDMNLATPPIISESARGKLDPDKSNGQRFDSTRRKLHVAS